MIEKHRESLRVAATLLAVLHHFDLNEELKSQYVDALRKLRPKRDVSALIGTEVDFLATVCERDGKVDNQIQRTIELAPREEAIVGLRRLKALVKDKHSRLLIQYKITARMRSLKATEHLKLKLAEQNGHGSTAQQASL